MKLLSIVAAAMLALGTGIAAAQDAPENESSTLKIGDAAPDFDLAAAVKAKEGEEDAPKKLSDYKGKMNVVLAFYPKADTPGCTTQMCGYRDDFSMFESADTTVIAISTDQQQDSDAFKDKFNMPFAVLGDPSQDIVKAYGVPTREMRGFQIAQRSVFLVDKEGKIAHIDMNYNIGNDKDPLYAEIKKLGEDKTED